MPTPKFEHLSLLAADAERSLDGLDHSLRRGTGGMSQGALHSRDLSGALSALGLDAAADLADDLARQMTLGQSSVLDVAQDLLPLIAKAVKDIQLGQFPDSDQQMETWGPWSSKLQVVVARDASPLRSFEAVVPKPSSEQRLAPLVGSEAPANPAPTSPLESASDYMVPAQAVGPSDPGFLALRHQGLNLIQSARILNQRDDERTVRQMDALLSELQDWSLRVGQVSLVELFPRFTHEFADVWLDRSLLTRLEPLRILEGAAARVQAQSRSLTIYMDWQQVSLTDDQYQQLGQCLRSVFGQIRRYEQGFRISFPCSLTRMRAIPFILNEQRYMVGGAQFIQFQPDADGPGIAGSLILRAGVDSKSLQVDRVLPAENMNLFELPHGMERPDWLSGVALDGMGEVYFCVAP